MIENSKSTRKFLKLLGKLGGILDKKIGFYWKLVVVYDSP
jgi:hypothetical protein